MKPGWESASRFRFALFIPLILTLFQLFTLRVWAQQFPGYLVITENSVFDLSPHAVYLADSSGKLTLSALWPEKHNQTFRPLSTVPDRKSNVHWLKITLRNGGLADSVFYANITFTDIIQLYEITPDGRIRSQLTGDLLPLSQRSVSIGQMSFVRLHLPHGQTRTYYLRLESSTAITRQFRTIALQSIQLYPRTAFEERFVHNRISQALFYGACLIMLLYNFFLMVVLRNRSYLFYVLYLLSLILFFASNNGYLAEWLLANHPRPDLYLRFLATPILLFFFLVFSLSFLQASNFSPRLRKLSGYILVALAGTVLLMLTGYWAAGRLVAVLLAILILLMVFVMALHAIRKGYSPAWYYLTANSILIAGGLAYALERIHGVSGSQLPQYGIQLGVVLELALFSLGLADSINLVRKELARKQLENERLHLQQEVELKLLAEKKNRELEQKVIERTTEIVAQNEEIQTQNEQLAQNYEELAAAQELIQSQNDVLLQLNQDLEARVKARTSELELTNAELQKAVAELDRFIYRTAHDIKGPLARLQGLTYVALMDITDESSRNYIEKLYAESVQLNAILSRLSAIHEIKNQELSHERIDFKILIDKILEEHLAGRNAGQFIPVEVSIRDATEYYTDPRLIRFILLNLLENALKFQKKKGDTPPLVAVRISSEPDSLILNITDNGIGIDAEDAPSIFDLFSRAARIHKTAGLGLYMTRLGVERLGGSIRLVPNAEQLTQFEVRLPKQVPVQKRIFSNGLPV